MDCNVRIVIFLLELSYYSIHSGQNNGFKGKWDSEEEFAEQLLDDCYPDIPEFARRYFDIEQFARDLFAYDYTFCDGYVFSDDTAKY